MFSDDFVARSPDELSLSKGDRIELIEKDDDFGDGWYLGKHLGNNSTGLFPEVYTRILSKSSLAQNGPLIQITPGNDVVDSQSKDVSTETIPSQNTVMNDTLDVIKEHINDLNGPRPNAKRGQSADSGSVYRNVNSHRASYIRGEETDEEESGSHTEKEVNNWTPEMLAEYLEEKGVDKQHCDVFREQEISGEVLLSMEQSSIFIKEFELGSVGRRLKTWQKIKSLQDEVRASATNLRAPSISGYSVAREEEEEEEAERVVEKDTLRSQSTSSVPDPTINFLSPEMGATRVQKLRAQAEPRGNTNTVNYSRQSTIIQPQLESSPKFEETSKPSPQDVRIMNHSRRHSSLGSEASIHRIMMSPSSKHRAQMSNDQIPSYASYDTLNQTKKRRSIFGHKYSASGSSNIDQTAEGWNLFPNGSPGDLDRGYFSGNEVDKRNRRSVLQKRVVASASHSRNPSEATIDGSGVRVSYQSPTTSKNDSPILQSQNNNNNNNNMFSKFNNMRSAKSPKMLPNNNIPANINVNGANTSPIVTRLEYEQQPSPAFAGSESSSILGNSPTAASHSFSFFSKPRMTALRVASDNITSPIGVARTVGESPTRVESTTPSTDSKSTELQKSDLSILSEGSSQSTNPSTLLSPATQNRPRVRSKKFTSAYTRGLEKKPPLEVIIDSDYSGWMRKKSASLVGTWKPRLFVLKGRRLSYFYSEHDTEEKGLIDISGHRVLPAEHDRMTGLHAQLTGAKTPQLLETTAITTSAATDLAASPLPESEQGLFIFKLVPPRTGMSKAVNFTKPTTHYFAVNSRQEGRLWMAALMKATIDHDNTGNVTTSYSQPTISLAKARARKERPPALRDGPSPLSTASITLTNTSENTSPSAYAINSEMGKGLGIGGIDVGHTDDESGDSGSVKITVIE